MSRPDPAPPAITAGQLLRMVPVREEIARRALQILAAVTFGAIFGHPALGAVAMLLFLGARDLWHLIVLRGWAEHSRRVTVPDAGGLWGVAYDLLVQRNDKSRRRKQQLVLMLEEFQASTSVLPDGAVVLGARGEIAWFNTSAQALLGLRLPQDAGVRITNLVRHPAFSRYFEAEAPDSEVEVPSPVNRGITLLMKAIPYGNRQKLLIVRDVSERKRLEEMRRDFVANASHELRTPLTVLRGYLDLIEADTRDGAMAAWREPVGEMRRQAARMESLITDLLKLARFESELAGRPETLDVPQMIGAALDGVRTLSGGLHRFELDLQPGLRLVGRETELQSVFANLLQNAVQYTPPGGSIRVQWRATDDCGACFSVADTGIGINQADIPRLTERFYRVDVARSRATGGTGLGLSIVKHALENHEARLEISSEPGVGSTFSCLFPPHRVVRAPAPVELSRTAP